MKRKLIDTLNEATYSGAYPNSGGVSGDDDLPTGTTVFGDKMKSEIVPNRLTGATKKWVPDLTKWNYDEFEHSMPMGSYDSYSDTLDGLDSIFGDRLWKHTSGKTQKFHKDKLDIRKSNDIDQTATLANDPDVEYASVQETVRKIERLLGEDATTKDIGTINKALITGKNAKINIKGLGLSLDVKNTKDGAVITYKANSDMDIVLVDIADMLDAEFSQKDKGGNTIFTLHI